MCTFIIGTSVSTAYASTYTTWSTRGVKYLCWTKDQITWTTNSKKITNVDTVQSRSGLFVVNNGITKCSSLSTSTKYVYLCKHTFSVGVTIGGVTLAWNTDVNDKATIYRSGKSSWTYDVG